jgi:hypothetical protein
LQRSIYFAWACLPIFVGAFWANESCATTIDPLTWEELVVGANFLGIAECEVAGGIVARYKVIEAWKGEAVGNSISVEIAVNAWEPQFPIALCGERFLFAAYKKPPSTMMSTTSYGAIPLWWRNIPSDYQTPLFQGGSKLGRESFYGFGSEHKSIEAFKKDALALLRLPPEERELRLLKTQAEKYLSAGRSRLDDAKSPEARARAELLRDIQQGKTAADVIGLILAAAQKEQDRSKRVFAAMLSRGGGEVTLATIEKLPGEDKSFDESARKDIAEEIRSHLGRPPVEAEASPAKAAQPKKLSQKELDQFRAALRKQLPLREAINALEALLAEDPTAVAGYLVQWINPEKEWQDRDSGYGLGSYFAHRSSKEREVFLTKLCTAHDPFVRVAGAVYLCFENREAGLAKLREFSALEGDPGVWAALNLAQRGERSAMLRALEVFATSGVSNMAGVPHRNLQKRLMVLLSNTAKASNLSQPTPPEYEREDEANQKKIYDAYQEWWKANGEKAAISDPWLPLLGKQKVD